MEKGAPVPRRSDFTPGITNRSTVVNRSSGGPYQQTRVERAPMRQSLMGSLPPGTYADSTSAGVNNFKEERTQEKADMQDLNNRLANYMEKMRYLEAMNKALEKEIEKLKKGKDVDYDKIKQMYEDELQQARKVIDDLSKDKADADVKVLSLEDENDFLKKERDNEEKDKEDYKHKAEKLGDQIGDYEGEIANLRRDNEEKDKEDYKHKAEKLGDQIGDYEGEIANLRFRVSALEDDIGKLQDTIKRLQSENARLRKDLDAETLAHINEANRAQGLEEELAFITQVYEQEIKELQDLARRDTTIEMRDFWKGEMGGALKDIQSEYDQRLAQISETLENKYNAQLSQISAGVNRDAMELNFVKEDNKKKTKKINDLQDDLAKLKAQNAALDERNRQLGDALKDKDEELDKEKDKREKETGALKDDLEGILRDMQDLIDAKLGLELEIAAYRKLLESEEDRFNPKKKLEDLGGFASPNADDMKKMVGQKKDDPEPPSKSETTGKLTINRTSRGGIAFADITPDGKRVSVSNNSKRLIKLSGWTIERHISDRAEPIAYTFPNYELPMGESVHIYAKWANNPCTEKNELLAKDIHSWGMGQAETYLRDDSEYRNEKASHKQAFVS